MKTPKGDQRLIRNHNHGLVVNLLRTDGPMSRTELARRIGLAPSVLTQPIRDLIGERLVVEAGKSAPNGGRPPTLLSFNPSYAYTVGVKIESSHLLAARVNLAGEICDRYTADLDSSPTPETVILQMEKAVKQLTAGRILGVGVSISGFVDTARGIDLYSPILNWKNVPLSAPMAAQLGLPVWLENDVNALTLAECWYGAGRRFQDFICLTVREGIGAGLVIGGELYHGAFGGAGEVGTSLSIPVALAAATANMGVLRRCTPRIGSWKRRLLGWIFRGFQLWLLPLTQKTVTRKTSFVRWAGPWELGQRTWSTC